MQIKEIKVKSILNRSKICDYCINPYIGCGNACLYCYARFICKYYSKPFDLWGQFAFIKINAPEILKKQLRSKKGNGSIYISSVTDPYQALEKKYELTKKCLEVLSNYSSKFKITIQTKSTLVLRDLELIKKLKAEVGFTIMSNDSWSKRLEPNADLPSSRIEALKKLHQNEIKTYVFVGPIIPKITDTLEIIKKTQKFTSYYFFDKLNYLPLLPKLRAIIEEKNLEQFYEKGKVKIQSYCNKRGIDYKILF